MANGGQIIPISLEAPKHLPRRVRKKDALQKSERQLARNLPKYLKKLEELAMGKVLMSKTDATGEVVIYALPPDRQALQFLVEHAKGKAPQRFELTGDEGGPLEFVAWAAPENIIEGELVG